MTMLKSATVARSERSLPRHWKAPLWAMRLTLGVALLVVWAAAAGNWIDELYLPAPLAVVESLNASISDGSLLRNLLVTMQETSLGLVIGSVAALILGVLLGRSKTWAGLLDPYLVALNATPRVALAPLFVVWFGIGLLSKVILVITLVFFIVFYNTFQGVRSADPNLIKVARVMGATQSQVFRSVILPAATPWIVLGLKLAVPYALIGAVIGEFIASSAGLGYQIKLASNTYDTAGTIAGIAVLMLVAVLLDVLLNAASRRLLYWQPQSQDEQKKPAARAEV